MTITMTVNEDGVTEYRENGKLHRLDGPALIYPDHLSRGYQGWYLHGKSHRVDGPARTWNNGEEEYWQNDLKHRINGPAFNYKDEKSDYLNNTLYQEKDYWLQIKKMKQNLRHDCVVCHRY